MQCRREIKDKGKELAVGVSPELEVWVALECIKKECM